MMPNSMPVLVFLHYFGGSARSWQWVAEQLADSYRCVVLNFPGFGNTSPLDAPSIQEMARYVQQETEQLELSSFVLIRHSMGGKIALQVAADDSSRSQCVRQLVLIAPSPPTVERMTDDEKERMLRHPDRDEAETTAETTVENATQQTLSAARQTLAVETQLEIDKATWRWWLRKGMDHSIADQASQITIPITVLASDDDPVIDPATIQREIMKKLPKAQLIRIQGIGHLLPLENPEWVADQIRRICQ